MAEATKLANVVKLIETGSATRASRGTHSEDSISRVFDGKKCFRCMRPGHMGTRKGNAELSNKRATCVGKKDISRVRRFAMKRNPLRVHSTWESGCSTRNRQRKAFNARLKRSRVAMRILC